MMVKQNIAASLKETEKKSFKKLEVVNNVMWERKVKTSPPKLGFYKGSGTQFFPNVTRGGFHRIPSNSWDANRVPENSTQL